MYEKQGGNEGAKTITISSFIIGGQHSRSSPVSQGFSFGHALTTIISIFLFSPYRRPNLKKDRVS